MGKIRRAIADFIRSRRADDKRHPRFQSGYLAGLYDARLEAQTTHEDGIIRLEKWPEEHVLWYHGQIVWRSGTDVLPVKPLLATRFKLSFDSQGRCTTFRKDQVEKLFGEWVWLIDATDGMNDPLYARPPAKPLDRDTEQKLREALRFAASRSVLSSEQERRILTALAPEGPNNG